MTDEIAKETSIKCNGQICTSTIKEDDNSREIEELKAISSTDKNDDDSKKKITKARRKESTDHAISSSIQTLHSQQDLNKIIESKPCVLVEFMTSWCGACKSIQDLYNDLSEANQDSICSTRIICDKNKQTKKLATAYKVGSYPVFIVFTNGQVTNRWDGADRGKLELAFERQRGKGSKEKKKRGGKFR